MTQKNAAIQSFPSQPFPWQQGEWQQFTTLVQNQRLPHGLMLSGPAEVGKHTFALAAAKLLLCELPIPQLFATANQQETLLPCGSCKACKLYEAHTHPDFYVIEPEVEGKAIKVDQIRALADFSAKTAAMGGRRVILVSPAEAMNINAANAFLKTLEEPGNGVSLLLVVHQPGQIIATIRSRCRIMPLSLPSHSQVENWLLPQQVDQQAIPEAITLSGGRPLRALRLLTTDLWQKRQAFQNTLQGVAANQLQPLDGAKILQGLSKTDSVEWFQYALYDRIKQCYADTNSVPEPFFRFLDRLNVVRQRLLSSANPNPQLVWEEVLMDWKTVIDLVDKHA